VIVNKENDDLEQPFPRPLSGAAVETLPSALIPSRQPIRGQTVELIPQDASKHAEDLFNAGHSNGRALRIWDYLAYGPWVDLDAYKATMRDQSSAFDTIFFAVRPLDSNHFQGQTSFLDINPQMGVIEVGHIWFGPKLQQTRAATEALYLMIKYAMDELGYRRMHWRCNSLNEKSRRAARRLGFRFEGVFYNHMIFKGKNRDTAWYSILDDEWPEVRGILESWLADDNFENGITKTSLFDSMQNRTPSRRGDTGE
jgi:RimJ/RimL family protein N-acetyltransferase